MPWHTLVAHRRGMVDIAPRPTAVSRFTGALRTQRAARELPVIGGARDIAVDTTRSVLLVIVVALHAFMVGVSLDANGTPVLENAMEHWAGWPVLTWFAQVMPLFFVLGGFASYTQYSRLRARGTTASAYISARLVRLLIPAGAAIAAVTVFLAALTVTGVSPDIIATAGFRISQPFWFLAVYIGVTALVPAMVWLHERNKLVTLLALALGALVVDIVRVTTDIAAIGALNFAFVWLFAQQLGFALADGTLDRLGTRAQRIMGIGALGTIVVTMLTGFYPTDLYAALNPPMGVLVLVGIMQTMIFLQLRTAIRRIGELPAIAQFVGWIGERSMTIYSWHMLVTIAIAGALINAPFALPVPVSTDWWLTRPLWFLVVGIAVFTVTSIAGRLERRRITAAPAGRGGVTAATLLAIAGVVLTLGLGSVGGAWVIATAAITAALALVMRRPGRTR